MPDDNTQFSCPLCDACDHDIRSGLLELTTNIMENLKRSSETLFDAIEAEGTGDSEFLTALRTFSDVRAQVSVVMDVIPDLAAAKSAR